MFAEERRELILKELFDNKKVNVIDLSKKFLVSQVIIRKDLKELENSGLLERTHGGAIEKRKLAHYTSFDDRKIISRCFGLVELSPSQRYPVGYEYKHYAQDKGVHTSEETIQSDKLEGI